MYIAEKYGIKGKYPEHEIIKIVSNRVTTMNESLKSCPFCGGEAQIEHDFMGNGYSYVHCLKCGLKSVMFMRSFEQASDILAIEYWNGRADNAAD